MLTDPSCASRGYRRLGRDVLTSRARRAVATLADCRACPRDCGVNRLEDRWAACKTGRYAVVSSFFPHFGEEDCLRGWNGSGTIFFGHCNLRCVFCQNFDISQDIKPAAERGSTPGDIARMMLAQRIASDLGLRRLDVRRPHPRLRRRMMLVEA
jgi:putative pyruvate formate lyase activating enzyme